MTTAIVTDSTADIPAQLREKHTIFQVPAYLIVEGKSLRDGLDISRETFYRNLPDYNALPSTSSPSRGDFERLYDKIFAAGYTEILSIHVASKLSGIYNAARLAAGDFGERVHIFDSGQVSLGLGFQVLEAARSAAKALPVDSITEMLQSLAERLHVYAFLDTFDYIQKSGRIPWITANLGSFLNVKPLIQLKNGVVHSAGIFRSRSQAIRHLRNKVHSLVPLQYLGILHSNALDDAREFLSRTRDSTEHEPIVVNVTPSIGIHVGPRALGFAAVVK